MRRFAFVALAVLAPFALACDSSKEGPDNTPVVDNGPEPDLVFEDTCECHAAGDCAGKVATPKVCEEIACEACTCLIRSKEKGTSCDDGNKDTFGDACDGRGVCIGRPASCGNGKCESPNEDCLNCNKDCGCPEGQWCQKKDDKNQCLVKPVADNGSCEPLENCRNSPNDCPCPTGQACTDGTCLACTEWCKAEGLNCGKPTAAPACDCGKCDTGWQCSALNQCYNPDICGNGVCDPTENCGSCATDCLCDNGQICLKGACSDCGTFCQDNGKECGYYFACDCGAAPLCHKCKSNVLVPDCECLCYPESKKQCGEVEGCQCGSLAGACPEGQDCVGFQCLEGCDTLCGTKECGWAEDCICDWCLGSDVCTANACGPGTEELDDHEFNDSPDEATDLGSTTDNDAASAQTVSGNIDSGYDSDWFKVAVDDVFGEDLVVHVELTGLPEDKDVDVAVCYLCNGDKTLAGAGVTPTDSVFEVESPIPNARCFASINLWGQNEVIDLDPTCTGGQDDSATIYFVVQPASDLDYGGAYTLTFHF
jgi:hypothetical protein